MAAKKTSQKKPRAPRSVYLRFAPDGTVRGGARHKGTALAEAANDEIVAGPYHLAERSGQE